ncbi:hypothetical protein M8J75_012694 [Diaphorina citri]|nr:hypothetical protein M8J75_012694 [Diaphorina citri]
MMLRASPLSITTEPNEPETRQTPQYKTKQKNIKSNIKKSMLRYPPQLTHQPPISRTLQYKKITKPLLERKRRARINRCLEQLKDLMVGALEAEGENINKLEKADILELTVRHLHRITKPHDPTEEVQRFQAGFTQCASEACGFLLSLPGLDTRVGKRLVEHLGKRISQSLEANPALLLSNGESFSPAGGYERDDYATLPRDARVPSSLGSATQDSLRSGVADNASSQSPAMMLPQSNPGISLNIPNSSLHPYQFRYFDSNYGQNHQGETSAQDMPESSSPQPEPSKPPSTTPAHSSGGQGSRPYPKLMCPQPTRPLMLSIPPERAGFGVPMSFQSSLSPETSMSRSPGVSMSGTSNAGSMPLLSPATSSSIVGEMDTRQDRMAISPGALSMDGSSSCHSEDMWRPW